MCRAPPAAYCPPLQFLVGPAHAAIDGLCVGTWVRACVTFFFVFSEEEKRFCVNKTPHGSEREREEGGKKASGLFLAVKGKKSSGREGGRLKALLLPLSYLSFCSGRGG